MTLLISSQRSSTVLRNWRSLVVIVSGKIVLDSYDLASARHRSWRNRCRLEQQTTYSCIRIFAMESIRRQVTLFHLLFQPKPSCHTKSASGNLRCWPYGQWRTCAEAGQARRASNTINTPRCMKPAVGSKAVRIQWRNVRSAAPYT